MSKRQSDANVFERSSKPKLSNGFKFSGSLARDLHPKAPYVVISYSHMQLIRSGSTYTIDIRQHAVNARVCSFKEKGAFDPLPLRSISRLTHHTQLIEDQ